MRARSHRYPSRANATGAGRVLTISRLTKFSIRYYNDTADAARQAAMDRQRAHDGPDTRIPTWLVVGDKEAVVRTAGLSDAALDGGDADTDDARVWLDDGSAPNGARGHDFTDTSIHGFDLMFAAPKSVSLLRALRDNLTEKVLTSAHIKALHAAMAYLNVHAGYTQTEIKTLQRLPGLVAIAYQHETSRCGDPHLHTHVILPNRQPDKGGRLVSIDSKSLYHEAKAAGVIYQATLRHELHTERGFEWNPVDPHSGAAEIAGVTKDTLKVWSRRLTRLRQWAKNTLTIVDGEPTAAQLAAAQTAASPAEPESRAWQELKEQWRADPRGVRLDRDAHFAARTERRAARRAALDRGRITAMAAHSMAAHIDKPAFTRADMVQLIGAQIPIDAPGEPLALIEGMVDAVSLRVSAPRGAHHREADERFTTAAVIAEEERVFEMVDAADNRARLNVHSRDVGDLSPDQARAIRSIAVSPFLVQPLQAPAGAGKTHSLKALRAAARRARKQVLVLAPTGKAVDEAMREGAGDRGLTVAKALALIADDKLKIIRNTVVIVDEASMLGTPELKKLLACAHFGRAKMVLVGDAYQLAPVKARGGMFEQLCADLPWSQRLGEVWRMKDPEERHTSLALRSAHGDRLDRAVRWYRDRGRLHAGDPVAMAADALDAYLADRGAGADTILICDTWEVADALNQRLHDTLTRPGPSVKAARDQRIRVGDIIMSRSNDVTIEITAARGADRADQVRNGNRWRVTSVDPDAGRLAAERLTDKARVVFQGAYLREHVTLGYAATVHSAQGVTADSSYAILGEGASRAMAYVAMTRGRHSNQAFLYQKFAEEPDQEHTEPVAAPTIHQLRRGSKYTAEHYFQQILLKDGRPRTMHAEAERIERNLLPGVVGAAIQRNEARRHARMAWWRDQLRSA